MELDLDDLEAKCRAATEGPWVIDATPIETESPHLMTVDGYGIADFWGDESGLGLEQNKHNAAFIAAFYPAVTLELIAQLRKARESVPALLNLVADIQGLMSESEGVAGLHRNGDVAPWDELEPGGRYERLGSLQAAIEVINKVEKNQ